ncbi:hypothetical protein ACQ1Q1_07200 [Ornithobacterium rhinotracheale]|uniref:MutS domain I n=1 Tax=Ornithobacterium rhinotracheale (strain ATCC 51463 / DSM 15997 / CCUG 23171 / CIP 104009 / LMG 9086) TaxID=867902 RepID=I3ZYG9_ORNRL|nr:MutS domain I [Ornithobacterium rhinotracheale]AFL96753.1 MutS domain I [Ornithobacterium rhinotracheale DSM 15997]MCK0199955.1 hypothetical protein [Ornithobacterium rhinotracheale]MCK0202677.1 hypothetical protein [Ornithobacterium rhinotracheale]
MNIAQKLKIVEEDRDNAVVFFKEGMFWKCYNAHAMYFILNVKPMKVSTRWYKNMNQYVHSIGFPDGALVKYVKQLRLGCAPAREVMEARIVRLQDLLWQQSMPYPTWSEEIVKAWEKKQRQAEMSQRREQLMQLIEEPRANEASESLLAQISQFDVNNATPVQAFNLVIDLQNKLKRIGEG